MFSYENNGIWRDEPRERMLSVPIETPASFVGEIILALEASSASASSAASGADASATAAAADSGADSDAAKKGLREKIIHYGVKLVNENQKSGAK